MTDCIAGVRAQVVFPVLAQLSELKGTLEGVERTQLRSSMLVSKLFTHHLDKLSVLPEFADLWLKMLKFMDSLMRLASRSSRDCHHDECHRWPRASALLAGPSTLAD